MPLSIQITLAALGLVFSVYVLLELRAIKKRQEGEAGRTDSIERTIRNLVDDVDELLD